MLLHRATVIPRLSAVTSARSIFSRTGVWPVTNNEVPDDIMKEVESFWKEKLTNYDTDISQHGVREGRGKKYVLAMFPYPSGQLHMGHFRVYTTSDAMARFYHHRGYQVLHPMGWDAFGLPAENAAIDQQQRPDQWTYHNIEQMKELLHHFGCRFDWHREIATCHPQYYKWTQAIFLRLYHAGLVYQDEAMVNWDPVDQTVLANEQVDSNGCSWRSGAQVERRFLKQWFIKTTRFAKSMLDGLSDSALENWRHIKDVQIGWIGDCNGYRVEMKAVHNATSQDKGDAGRLDLWMPEPELLYGVSFIGVHTGHRLHTLATSSQECVGQYQVLDVSAVCPLSERSIPVIVCDDLPYCYERSEFYIGIPSISETDREIANTCNFPVVGVIENGRLVNSPHLDGLTPEEARQVVTQLLLKLKSGGFQTSAILQDWLISRQRYWGTPIPIIHCPACGAVPVPEQQLPVELPSISDFTSRGLSPLKTAVDWLRCSCPKCGGEAERETDTMDTFVDSSWYFLRYLDPRNQEQMVGPELQHSLMPVDLYVGGKEHAVLHLFYARFIQQFLASEGLVSAWEPFKRLLMMGVVKGPSYRVRTTGTYLTRDQVDFVADPPVERETGAQLVITSEKMSKSKYNGVDPQEVLQKYGTDMSRLFMLASVGPSSERSWSDDTFPGLIGWQKRLFLTVADFISKRTEKAERTLSKDKLEEYEQFVWSSRNHCLRHVTHSFDHTHLISVAIASMMKLTGCLRRVPGEVMLTEEYERSLGDLIVVLAPVMPHLACELWAGFTSAATSPHTNKRLTSTVLEQEWPEVDQDFCLPLQFLVAQEEQQVLLPRKKLDTLTGEEALGLVAQQEEFQKYLQGRAVTETSLTVFPGSHATVNFKFKVTDAAVASAYTRTSKKDKKKKKKLKKS